MKPKISIIVPIYNSEEYLEQAIQSLLDQTLSELEVILVNDGSIDESLTIANKYKVLDSRIKVISQENKGVSSARNYGLSVAQGEYVAFIDSDDYVDKEMYEYMYTIAKEHHLDLIITDLEQHIDGKKIIHPLVVKANSLLVKENIRREVMPQFLCDEKLNTVCNKLLVLV